MTVHQRHRLAIALVAVACVWLALAAVTAAIWALGLALVCALIAAPLSASAD